MLRLQVPLPQAINHNPRARRVPTMMANGTQPILYGALLAQLFPQAPLLLLFLQRHYSRYQLLQYGDTPAQSG